MGQPTRAGRGQVRTATFRQIPAAAQRHRLEQRHSDRRDGRRSEEDLARGVAERNPHDLPHPGRQVGEVEAVSPPGPPAAAPAAQMLRAAKTSMMLWCTRRTSTAPKTKTPMAPPTDRKNAIVEREMV
jgi:hypothetical protein